MYIENQLDPKWNKWYIGKVKTSRFKDFACYLFCLTYMYSVKIGKQVSPGTVDMILSGGGAYDGDQIINNKVEPLLGLHYLGYETDINKAPDWHPSIKRVDYSARPGKQYHFVVREVINGKKVILDPVGGVQRDINYYERLVGDTAWRGGAFNYRLWKI